jgi:hypothetical protein
MAQRTFFIFLFALAASAQVVITEINRDPVGGASSIPGGASHEFVELTNFGIDTFSIDSLYLTDGAEIDGVVPWPSPLAAHPDCIIGSRIIPPGGTALVLDRDYDSALAIAPSSKLLIRRNTVLLTTEDHDLGNSLAADDGVLIYKGTKTAITRILWCAADSAFSGAVPPKTKITLSIAAPKGYSVVPTAFLFDSVRYAICSDSMTPGFFEALGNNWFTELRIGEPDTAHRTFACTLACCKCGGVPNGPVRWSVAMQSRTGTVTAAEGVCAVTGNRGDAVMALPLDSVSYFLHLSEQGVETVRRIDISQLYTPSSPVRINELFPRATAGEPEWIELCNVSQMSINIKNWTFGNSESADTIALADFPLAPGDFIVLTSNGGLFRQRYPAKSRLIVPSHWHTLDNYNDTISLWDAKHRLKETICYRSTWFTGWSNQSLERTSPASPGIDPASWSLAASPTPGQPNNALYLNSSPQPDITIGPLPFTPNGDGRDDLLSITINQTPASSATLTIYGFSGRKLRAFTGPLPRQILWNGRQDNGEPAPVGPFFIVLETHSSKGVSFVRKKGVLWR